VPATLQIVPIENLVPPGEVRLIGVGETLGDDTLSSSLTASMCSRHNKLTIEPLALGQQIEHLLEALHPVAVARDQPATDGVGRSPEAIELGLEDPFRMVEWLGPLSGVDQQQHRFHSGSSVRSYSSVIHVTRNPPRKVYSIDMQWAHGQPEDTTMFNSTKIVLAAALILSATCVSFAKSQGGSPEAAQSEKDFWELRHSRTYLRVVDETREQPVLVGDASEA
jgi:hypothetical protein